MIARRSSGTWTALPKPVDDPILAYTADAEVNQLQWSTAHQHGSRSPTTTRSSALHVYWRGSLLFGVGGSRRRRGRRYRRRRDRHAVGRDADDDNRAVGSGGPPAGSTFRDRACGARSDLTSEHQQCAAPAAPACLLSGVTSRGTAPRRPRSRLLHLLIRVAPRLHGLDGGLAQRVGI